MIYRKPSKKVHRGFFYLNDETVINSLSAVESGKIDEVVEKINSARKGGFAAGVGIQGLKLEGGKEATSAFEEEVVRTRTRFSIFELWYQSLLSEKALGTFDGWGADALNGVSPGDTVELRATLEVVPLLTLFRLYLWFAGQIKNQNPIFGIQKGDELKATKDAERHIKMLLGEMDEGPQSQTVVLATPVGDPGPRVAMPLSAEWMIGRIGQLGGEYSIVAQVNQILADGKQLPTMRLTHDVAATPLEVRTLKEVVAHFVEPAKAIGVETSEDDSSISGPALWLEPIAVYR